MKLAKPQREMVSFSYQFGRVFGRLQGNSGSESNIAAAIACNATACDRTARLEALEKWP